VTIDDSANQSVYGDDFETEKILNGAVSMPAEGRPFIDVVQRYASSKGRTSEKGAVR
jgi:lipid-binding SYLF domain-containing protein